MEIDVEIVGNFMSFVFCRNAWFFVGIFVTVTVGLLQVPVKMYDSHSNIVSNFVFEKVLYDLAEKIIFCGHCNPFMESKFEQPTKIQYWAYMSVI